MQTAHIVVVDNGDTEPELWGFASEAKASEFACVRSSSASVVDVAILSDEDADVEIERERSEFGKERLG